MFEKFQKFPEHLDSVLKEIAKAYQFGLAENTVFEVENRVLFWNEEHNIKKRLDFTCIGEEIVVTILTEKYPVRPIFWPFSPFGVKISWENVDKLSIHENSESFREKAISYLKAYKKI